MKLVKDIKGIGAITFTALSFAIATIFSRWVGNEIPLFYQSATRALFCGILIIAWIFLIKRESIPYHKKDVPWLLIRSVAGTFGFLGWFVGITNTTIGVTYFAYFAGTLLASYVLARLFFKEKITTVKLLSLFLALIGLTLTYFQSGLDKLDWYALMAVAGGISYGLWIILVKKLKGGYSSLQITMIDFMLSGILFSVASLMVNEAWTVPVVNMPWIGSLAMSAVWIFGGISLVYGFKRLEATIGSLILLLEVPLALLIGGIFYQEQLSLFAWIGGALILVACSMPEIYALRQKRSK